MVAMCETGGLHYAFVYVRAAGEIQVDVLRLAADGTEKSCAGSSY